MRSDQEIRLFSEGEVRLITRVTSPGEEFAVTRAFEDIEDAFEDSLKMLLEDRCESMLHAFFLGLGVEFTTMLKI